MSGYIDSFFEHWQKRTRTTVYGLFAFWWIALHSELFYTVLFVDQDKILSQKHMLKNEYIWSKYIQHQYLSFWIWQAILFATACLLTYLMIWWLPRLVINRAYAKEKDNDFDRQEIKIRADKKIEKLKARLEGQKRTTLREAETTRQVEKKIEKQTPEVVWEREYQQLKASNLWSFFDELVESLYRHGGKVTYIGRGFANNPEFQINQDILAYADSNALIDYDRKANTISLTDKGKYFVKQYQSQA